MRKQATQPQVYGSTQGDDVWHRAGVVSGRASQDPLGEEHSMLQQQTVRLDHDDQATQHFTRGHHWAYRACA